MEMFEISKDQNTIYDGKLTLRFMDGEDVCFRCHYWSPSTFCERRDIPCTSARRLDHRDGHFELVSPSFGKAVKKYWMRFWNTKKTTQIIVRGALNKTIKNQIITKKDMDIKDLKPEERKALLEQLQQQDAADKQQKENNVIAYKASVNENVKAAFPILKAVAANLAEEKAKIRDMFAASMSLKSELYGVKTDQRSHTFTDSEGLHRITLGVNINDNYDDTVDTGIQIVKEYIGSLAKDADSKLLVDTILKLLSRDQKGTLKATRVLQLQQLAEKSGNARFLEGVNIIKDAYRPTESKSYIKAEYKDENGAWVSLPLGITEA